MPPGDPDALAQAILRVLGDADLRARIGAAGRDRVLDRFTWRADRRTAPPSSTALCSRTTYGERTARRLMLTVDFDRLGLADGERLLDLGCGGGRHAFEAMRRGATVVALDYDAAELEGACATSRGAMLDAGEIAATGTAAAR